MCIVHEIWSLNLFISPYQYLLCYLVQVSCDMTVFFLHILFSSFVDNNNKKLDFFFLVRLEFTYRNYHINCDFFLYNMKIVCVNGFWSHRIRWLGHQKYGKVNSLFYLVFGHYTNQNLFELCKYALNSIAL